MKQTSDELLKVSLEIFDSQNCTERLEDELDDQIIDPTQICAGGSRNKVCSC